MLISSMNHRKTKMCTKYATIVIFFAMCPISFVRLRYILYWTVIHGYLSVYRQMSLGI